MINLDRHEIDFSCPNCGFYNKFFLKQARLRDVIICRGCKINIQLEDYMNECRKATRNIKRALDEFEQNLKNIHLKITI